MPCPAACRAAPQVVLATCEQRSCAPECGSCVDRSTIASSPSLRLFSGLKSPLRSTGAARHGEGASCRATSWMAKRRVLPTAASHAGPPLEKSLRGDFGIAQTSSGGIPAAGSVAVGAGAAANVPSLPMDAENIANVLEDALESARMRRRAVRTVGTIAAVSLVLISFIAGSLDQYLVSLRAREGSTAEELYDQFDAYALRIHLWILCGSLVRAARRRASATALCVLPASRTAHSRSRQPAACVLAMCLCPSLALPLAREQGACAMVLSLAPGSSDRRRAWIVSFVLGAVVMVLGVWQYVLNFLTADLYNPPDQFRNSLSEADVGGRPPAFWHAARVAFFVARITNYVVIWLIGGAYIVWVRSSTRAVARALSVVLGISIMMQASIDVYQMALGLSAGLPRAGWFWPAESVQAAVGLAVGVWMLLPFARTRTQMLFARISGHSLHGGRQETALAALVGYGSNGCKDPTVLVTNALHSFSPAELTVARLRKMGPTLFVPVEQRRASTLWRTGFKQARLRDLAGAAARTGTADCYVLDSSADDPAEKLEALCAWVGRFEAAMGRPPRVWLSSLCADPSLSRVEQLEHVPVYLARSHHLLLLTSSRGITHLWTAIELFSFRALGGHVDHIDVAIVRPQPSGSERTPSGDSVERMYLGSVLSAFDTFHAMLTSTRDEKPEVRSRLLYAVELVSVASFNSVVREVMPRVRAASAPVACSSELMSCSSTTINNEQQ